MIRVINQESLFIIKGTGCFLKTYTVLTSIAYGFV